MAILKFWIFRQNSEFGHLRSIFPSKGNLWTLQAIFIIKTSIYGPYGPYISSRKSIFGPYGPYISCGKPIYGPSVSPFLEKVLIYGPSVSPFLEKVFIYGPSVSPFLDSLLTGASSVSPFLCTLLTGVRPFFSCFLSPYFINRGGLLTGGMGYCFTIALAKADRSEGFHIKILMFIVFSRFAVVC